MQVVLLKDVKSLGKRGDLVKVADGYARNFLFPKELATPATGGALRAREEALEAQKRKEERELQAAKEMVGRIDGKTVVVQAKAGEAGRLFGAVTAQQVANAVKARLGVEIDRRRLHLPDAVKRLGSYEIEVRPHTGLTARFTLVVEAIRET